MLISTSRNTTLIVPRLFYSLITCSLSSTIHITPDSLITLNVVTACGVSIDAIDASQQQNSTLTAAWCFSREGQPQPPSNKAYRHFPSQYPTSTHALLAFDGAQWQIHIRQQIVNVICMSCTHSDRIGHTHFVVKHGWKQFTLGCNS